jgi:hypothetical protein
MNPAMSNIFTLSQGLTLIPNSDVLPLGAHSIVLIKKYSIMSYVLQAFNFVESKTPGFMSLEITLISTIRTLHRVTAPIFICLL